MAGHAIAAEAERLGQEAEGYAFLAVACSGLLRLPVMLH
jgi:hypothetical protein